MRLDVSANVHFDLFLTTVFGNSEHKWGKVYEVYTHTLNLGLVGMWYISSQNWNCQLRISGWSR